MRANILEDKQIANTGPPKGHFRCGHCKICHTVKEDCNVLLRDQYVTIRHDSFSTCATEGVVYLLKCTCSPPLLYVGKTLRCLRTRLLEHQSRLRLKTPEVPLVEHFTRKGHREQEFSHTVLHVGRS